DNIETLAPIIPPVMRAIRDNVSDVDESAQEDIHRQIRELIQRKHHVAQVDVNLAYMVRVLRERRSRENEQLLVQLYSQPHGYGDGRAPNRQRDIVLTMANWGVTYWLHDRRPHYRTMHEWVQRAFVIGSYAMGDEGRHWRGGIRRSLTEFDEIVAQWAGERAQ